MLAWQLQESLKKHGYASTQFQRIINMNSEMQGTMLTFAATCPVGQVRFNFHLPYSNFHLPL